MNIQIQGWNQNIPLQRVNDKGIMNAFVQKGYSIEKLKVLNKCRKYLEIMTLSDIVPTSGSKICSDAIDESATNIKSPFSNGRIYTNRICNFGVYGKKRFVTPSVLITTQTCSGNHY